MAITELDVAFAWAGATAEQVRLATLPVGHAWRAQGLDEAHVVVLAGTLRSTPPILVNRRDMTVVDGAHRVAAARRRGTGTIAVEWFDGTEFEALGEFFRRNSHDGLPIGIADRTRGVQRALRSQPGWSDRRIAHLCGASPKLVARLRRDDAATGNVGEKRIGRDGRSRPVRPGAMRQQIVEALESDPAASLRVIASRLGVSPETVRTIRRELNDDSSRPTALPLGRLLDLDEQRRRILQRLPASAPWRDDQAFHSTEEGVSFVEWFDSTSVEGCEHRLDEVPLSRVYEIADEARRRAAFWSTLADDLERRTRNRR